MSKLKVIAILLVCFVFGGATGLSMPKKIVLNQYPTIKIGFTTGNFAKVMPLTVENEKKLIDFASQQGFSFIELRDPAAKFSLEEAKEIAAYAKKKNVEVVYAVMTGALDSNYQEVFARALANAQVFDGPPLIRTAAVGTEITSNPAKKYWTRKDFAGLVETLNQSGNTAKMFGLTLVVENGREGLQGDGVESFGTEQLFGEKGVNANVGFQLDTANFFCVSRVVTPVDEAKQFFEKNVSRIGYTHLKTSKEHVPQKVLGENELPFGVYFKELAKQGKVYVAIELDTNVAQLDEAYANHIQCVNYLTGKY